MNELTIKPIGILKSNKKYRYEAPRQAVLADEAQAVIKLDPGNNFEQALEDLDGFERIWVIYLFHLNSSWKPKVMPPRNSEKKIGVFATRAPYRPNPIGISCVKLVKIEGLKLYISGSDILDGSPIIDIKPYLPYSDSFPESKTGWAGIISAVTFQTAFEPTAIVQIRWLEKTGGVYLEDFIKLQLETAPADNSRKRIYRSKDALLPEDEYILAYRTWRIHYKIFYEDNLVRIYAISSGYSKEELANSAEDKYKDKSLHLLFIKEFE